jgi:hypothetical protein
LLIVSPLVILDQVLVVVLVSVVVMVLAMVLVMNRRAMVCIEMKSLKSWRYDKKEQNCQHITSMLRVCKECDCSLLICVGYKVTN